MATNGRTHYVGCERAHLDCALVHLDAVRSLLDEAIAERDRLRANLEEREGASILDLLRKAREIVAKATPGFWQLYTSNSFRRFGVRGDYRTVVEPITQRPDGHPDLHFRNPDDAAHIILHSPAVVAAVWDFLIAEHAVSTDNSDDAAEDRYQLAKDALVEVLRVELEG
jgi:hypothetical protein